MKSFLLLLALCVSAAAQSITATTPDGKKVILNPDQTWKYAPPETDAVLSIEAGLVFQNGEVRPVARATFLLLDEDPIEILVKAGVKPTVGSSNFDSDLKVQLLFALTRTKADNCPDCNRFLIESRKALSARTVKSVDTGFDGKASFEPVKPGAYHLFGVYSVLKNDILWLSKLDLKAGATTLKLDLRNAALTF